MGRFPAPAEVAARSPEQMPEAETEESAPALAEASDAKQNLDPCACWEMLGGSIPNGWGNIRNPSFGFFRISLRNM